MVLEISLLTVFCPTRFFARHLIVASRPKVALTLVKVAFWLDFSTDLVPIEILGLTIEIISSSCPPRIDLMTRK